MSHEREQGRIRWKAILVLAILLAGGYTLVKVVPVYVSNYQLQDKLQTEARFAVVNHRTDDELRDIIYREMQEDNIPARREDIQIENTRSRVRISVDYTVTIDLKLYQFQLHFNPVGENRSLF